MASFRWTNGSRSVACVYLPRFCWQAEAARRPETKGQPVIITGSENGQRKVLSHAPWVEGVSSGMPLSEAISLNKGAILMEPDLPHYRRSFDAVLDALQQSCPDVEEQDLGVAYADISGVERLYGGTAGALHALGESVQGYEARMGLGENKWLAYVAAAMSKHGRAIRVTGDPGRFLSPLSVDILPVSYKAIQRLHSFGLSTLGQVADIPPGPMQAQFGREGRLITELASGIDNRPIVPRQPQRTVSARLQFPSATVSMESIMAAADSLLSRAFNSKELSGRYAREALLEAGVLSHPSWTQRVVFQKPVGSAAQALFAIRAKLADASLPGPLEELSVTLSGIVGEAGRQGALFPDMRDAESLREAVDQLRSRLGEPPPLYRVMEMEPWSRIPERRHALVRLRD
ncbi:MAG: DNA polymerase Y family protein [Chloroflexota bacterium]